MSTIPLHRACAARALLWAALLILGACSDTSRPRPADEGCVPQCQDRCDGPDGCGGECTCPDACRPGRPCEHAECGLCAANEICVAGQCVCTPQCDGQACLPDGCGGTCDCPEGYVQDARGRWLPPEQCKDSCATAGWACGAVCGEACGTCQDGAACTPGHQCAAAPCDGARCDGGCACAEGTSCDASGACVAPAACDDSCEAAGAACGEVCGSFCGRCGDQEACVDGRCARAVSCADCPLRLELVTKRVAVDRVVEAVVAVRYEPTQGEPRPRLADLRLTLHGDGALMDLVEGDALEQAHKRLHVDDKTGKPWRRRPDGSFQLLVYSAEDRSDVLGSGTLFLLHLAHSQAAPLGVALQRRAQTFAPPQADAALQAYDYERVLWVTP